MESSCHKDGGTILPGLGSLKLSPTSRAIKPNKGFKIFHTFFLAGGTKDEVCQRLFAYFKLNLSFL